MDQESLNLCKRLEQSQSAIQANVNTIQNNMGAVLHLLRGNELDDESGMINQLKSLRMDLMLLSKKHDDNRTIIFDKLASDKQVLENKIELVKMEFIAKYETRLANVEKWKDKVIWLVAGIGIGGGFGLKTLIDFLSKSH